jgi:hypothetical protein
VLGLSLVAACNAILGNEERTLFREPGGDSSTGGTGGIGGSAGASGSGGSGGNITDSSVDAEADAPPVIVDCDAGVTDDAGVGFCPGNVLYVSDTTGSDSNSGCSPCFPKATVGAAIASLKALESPDAGPSGYPEGFALHLCAGEYAELALVLDIPVSILGAYDCTTWQRTADYGWPNFDKVAETIIKNGNANQSDQTLRVEGSTQDSDVVIDGLTFVGWEATSPPANSAALYVSLGATPIVTNNLIQGGSGVGNGNGGGSTNIASVGLWIDGASPNVFHNEIDGGSGSDADWGSVGVFVRGAAASPFIHENRIRGGSGQSFDGGSFGVRAVEGATMTVAGGNPLTQNEIWSGTGTDGGLMIPTAAGVYVQAVVDIVNNEIHVDPSTASAAIVAGVVTFTGITVARNRIHGGTASTGSTVGVWVKGTGVKVENNMIHAGSGSSGATGIWLESAVSPSLLHNTIYTGTTQTSTDVTQLRLDDADQAIIRGNILLAAADTFFPAIIMDECLNTDAFAELHDNAFVATDKLALLQSGGCPNVIISHMSNLQNPITPGSAGGNIRFKAPGTCSTEPGCTEIAACAGNGNAQQCFDLLFEAWSAADDGLGTLFDTGWKLEANTVPCPISKAIFTQTSSSDLFGASRSTPISFGAHEQDGPCSSL